MIDSTPPVALVTYSTQPRGGVVHTLHLADALAALGQPVRVIALGDPKVGFFRPVEAPTTIVPAPPRRPTLEERVFASIDTLAAGLRRTLAGERLVHVQDCIAARAAERLRDDGLGIEIIRTVHHVDDFTTPALIECQQRSILRPDRILTVSRYWRDRLAREYGVEATVVTNGVDTARFAAPPAVDPASLRRRVGGDARPLLLAVGGIEPRKGSRELVEALAQVREQLDPAPLLVVVGGHSFRDYRAYREAVLARANELAVDRDLVLVGTVSDDELHAWYHAADALVFPSVKEGFGLVVLEAMAAGLPVVANDLPVLQEHLRHDRDALLVPAEDPARFAAAIVRVVRDPELRSRLAGRGREVAASFTWERCARQHLALYATGTVPTPRHAV